MASSSEPGSFYERPPKYDAGKTLSLYNKLKADFQIAYKTLKDIQDDMLRLNKDVLITVKLIEKLESKKIETNVQAEEELEIL